MEILDVQVYERQKMYKLVPKRTIKRIENMDENE